MYPRAAGLLVVIAFASSACEQRPAPVTAPAGDKREPPPGGVAHVQTADTDPERIVGGAMAMQLVPQPPQSWDTCHDAGAPPMPWPPMPWGSTDAGGGCRTIMVPRSDRFVAQFVVAGPLVLTDASLSGYFERLTLFTVPTGSKCGAPDGLSIPPEAEMLGDVPMNGMHGARYLVKVGHSLCCLGSGAVMFVSDGGANPALKLVWSGFVPY